MKNFKFKRSLTLIAVSSLLSITVVSIPTVAQAAPACTTANYVTTCLGATTDTAPYMLITPATSMELFISTLMGIVQTFQFLQEFQDMVATPSQILQSQHLAVILKLSELFLLRDMR